MLDKKLCVVRTSCGSYTSSMYVLEFGCVTGCDYEYVVVTGDGVGVHRSKYTDLSRLCFRTALFLTRYLSMHTNYTKTL
jgi:hypothetical protein